MIITDQVHAILIAKRDAAATSNDENTVKFWEGGTSTRPSLALQLWHASSDSPSD